MSKYRRFVAYVYEYQKQKKGNNRGFVRVENKEGVCDFQINLRCPGLCTGRKQNDRNIVEGMCDTDGWSPVGI